MAWTFQLGSASSHLRRNSTSSHAFLSIRPCHSSNGRAVAGHGQPHPAGRRTLRSRPLSRPVSPKARAQVVKPSGWKAVRGNGPRVSGLGVGRAERQPARSASRFPSPLWGGARESLPLGSPRIVISGRPTVTSSPRAAACPCASPWRAPPAASRSSTSPSSSTAP